MDNLWENANNLPIQVGPEITGSFDVGFDEKIPEETKDALMRFIYWVEDHYTLPVTLWVDFKFNHYLMTRDKRRVGYRFYWADFTTWPAFENPDDIPVIELPVRTEKWSIRSVLGSFIQAISMYYIWLSNGNTHEEEPEDALVDEILQRYYDEIEKEETL
jgi:hypothetical protein